MRWFWLVPAAAFLAYSVHSLFKYTRMISNIFLGLIYTPDSTPPASELGERVTILDSADHEIEALVLESRLPKGIVVFCHESGASKASWEKYASFLPSNGYHVIAPDIDRVRGPEEPNGLSQWPDEQEVDRLDIVVRWARKAYGTLPTVLFGVSKGANLALAASMREPRVQAVVADGLFSMREIFRDYIRKWAPVLVRPNFFGDKFPEWIVRLFAASGYWNSKRVTKKNFVDVESLLRKPHPPLLVIHGELDDYVPKTHQTLLERIGRSGSFVHLRVPAAGHNEAVAVAREEYQRRVLNFMDAPL